MRCLLIVDVQKDFCPKGKLGVEGGHEIVPIINRLMSSTVYGIVVASQDWHPANHGSFVTQHPGKKALDMGELAGRPQTIWPVHCVQGTSGAEFHEDLDMSRIAFIQQKGLDPKIDSYSAFQDNAGDALTGLHSYLIARGVTELDICGIATDVCAKFTALNAVVLLPGVKVRFIADASRGLSPEGVKQALEEMAASGIEIVTSAEILLAA